MEGGRKKKRIKNSAQERRILVKQFQDILRTFKDDASAVRDASFFYLLWIVRNRDKKFPK